MSVLCYLCPFFLLQQRHRRNSRQNYGQLIDDSIGEERYECAVKCRPSRDNRHDMARWQVDDGTEGFSVSVEGGRER